MSENETIKTKKVRSIKSFFSAPKKIKLEVNDFDSPSADVINSKTTNVNKNIHHSTEMMVEQNKTNTEFSKAFKYNTNEQLNQELEKSNYSSSSSTCSSVDLCSSSYESDDEIDKSIITNCETELEFIVKPQSLRTVLGPYDISQTIDEEPYQPNLKNFPKTTYGTGQTKRTRRFSILLTYDGANVMRGSINGVQALFKNKVPHAFYIHCHNHRLNLVLVDVAKNVDEVNFFFNFLQDLYNFISGSSIHSKFIELQKQIFKIPKPIELKRLCLTRWSSQIHTCRAVKATLEVILLLLYNISNEKSIRSSEAIGLLKNIDFKFIYLLLFFNDLISQINLLTKYLQDKNADMAKAIILMNSLKEHFCEIRNDLNYHSKLYSETKLIANKLNIKHPSAHNREKNRVKKLPKHLQKYIVEGNSLESSVLSSETDFRNNLYLIIIDKINAELNKRFSNNEDLLMGISVLDPSNSNFLDKKLIHPFALSYMCDIDTLDSELNIIRKSLKQFEAKYHSIKTIFQFHKFLLDYQLAFFELYKLCTIAITIPVSSAACERTFSYMKRIKSYLRNSMLHDNLSSLSIIAIEKSEAKLLNIDDKINNFAECHNNRRIILK
ncbi:hypothetical protein QTP88_016212 [Uroleucon formosanum]